MHDPIALGFVRSTDGTLTPPNGAAVQLIPTAQYIEVQILLAEGEQQSLRAVIHETALKLGPERERP
jgi:hypothetical protein